jgi:hypothetical protein
VVTGGSAGGAARGGLAAGLLVVVRFVVVPVERLVVELCTRTTDVPGATALAPTGGASAGSDSGHAAPACLGVGAGVVFVAFLCGAVACRPIAVTAVAASAPTVSPPDMRRTRDTPASRADGSALRAALTAPPPNDQTPPRGEADT